MLGYHPPGPGRPPRTRQTPPDQADPWTRQTPPWADTISPGPGRHHPPRPDPPPPDLADHPPLGSRLQHTVYERPVRILLECILVLFSFDIFNLLREFYRVTKLQTPQNANSTDTNENDIFLKCCQLLCLSRENEKQYYYLQICPFHNGTLLIWLNRKKTLFSF